MSCPWRSVEFLVLFAGTFTLFPIQAQDPGSEVRRVTRAHEVRSLVEPIPRFPVDREGYPDALRALLGYTRDASAARGSGLGMEGPVTEGRLLSLGALLDLLRENIAEDSWSNRNNTLEIRRGKLVVVQTPDVQARIGELLAALRAWRARTIAVDVAVVPVDALGDVDWHSRDELDGGSFSAIVERAGNDAFRVALAAYNNQTVSAFEGEERAFLIDDVVETKGVVPVASAVSERYPLGLTVEVQPRVIEGSGRIVLRLLASWVDTEGEVRVRQGVSCPLQEVSLLVQKLEGTLVVRPGRTVVAGVFEASTGDDSQVAFAVVTRSRLLDVRESVALPSVDAGTHVLHIYDVGFLTEASDGRRASLDGGLLRRSIRRNVDVEAWEDLRASLHVDSGLLLARARPRTQERIAAWLEEQIARFGRAVSLEVLELEGPLDAALDLQALADDSRSLPGDWRNSNAGQRLQTVSHATVRSLPGRPVRARCLQARTYFARVENVAGGTGFQIAELGEPIVEYSRNGFTLESRLRPLPGADRWALDLDLDGSSTRLQRQAGVEASTGRAAAESSVLDAETQRGDAIDRQEVPASVPVEIDLADWEESSTILTTTLLPGRHVLLQAREAGDGEARLVIARVRTPKGKGLDADWAENERQQRALRVHELHSVAMGSDPSPAELPEFLELRDTEPSHDPAIGPFDRGSSREEDRHRSHDASIAGHAILQPGDLPRLIRDFIATDSWNNERNSMDVSNARMIIVQRPEVLGDVEDLVAGLSARAERELLVELALAPTAAVDATVPGWSRPGSLPWLEGDVLTRVVRAGGPSARYLAARARPAVTRAFTGSSVSSFVVDQDVDRSGVVPVVVARVKALRRGVFSRFRVLLDPEGTWCRADVTLGRASASAQAIERHRLPRGDLDLTRRGQTRTATSVAGPVGHTLVLGSYSAASLADESVGDGEEPASFVALLRVRKLFAGATSRVASLAAVDLDFLTRPLPGDRTFGDASSRRQPDTVTVPFIDPAVLEADLRLVLGADTFLRFYGNVPTAFFRADPQALDDVLQEVRSLSRERIRPITVDLWQGSVPSGEIETRQSGTALAGGEWVARIGDSAGRRLRIVGLSGAVQSLASVQSRTHVESLRAVSGGTGFQLKEARDPVIASVAHGASLKAQATVVSGTPWAQLRVQAEFADRPSFGAGLRVGRVARDPDREEENEGLRAGGAGVELDLPRRPVERWERFVTAPLGQPVLIHAASDRTEPGNTRVVVAIVNAFRLGDTTAR